MRMKKMHDTKKKVVALVGRMAKQAPLTIGYIHHRKSELYGK